jgi:hypothetical protein
LRHQGRLAAAFEQYSKALDIGTGPVRTARTYANMSVTATLLRRHNNAIQLHDSILVTLKTSPETMDQKLLFIYSTAGEEMFNSYEHQLVTSSKRRMNTTAPLSSREQHWRLAKDIAEVLETARLLANVTTDYHANQRSEFRWQ